MKIYTVTLNPAYDIHAYTEHFVPFCENLATVTSKEAGGKGVNVSRALDNCGVANTAVIVLGKDNAEEFKALLEADRLDAVYFYADGRIRENLTIRCADSRETRISFPGTKTDSSILQSIDSLLSVDSDTIIAFCGSLPAGVPTDAVKQLLIKYKTMGAKLVIDSRSFSLADITDIRPWLIKPNEEEISKLLGCRIETAEDVLSHSELLSSIGVQNIMISLGAEGAVLISESGLYRARPPHITPHSTIGAGDSSIAGFIAATAEHGSDAECLKAAVASGSAACLTDGSRPPLKADIQKILPYVTVETL